MVLGISQKTKHIKKPMMDISSLARSVTPVGTSTLFSSLKVKQIHSFAFSMLAASSLGNITNPTLPILPQAKAAVFISANHLQSWRILPVSAVTSSLAPFYGPNKQDEPDEQVLSSPPWPSILEFKNLQG